jgi:site-specific DNA recombinase
MDPTSASGRVVIGVLGEIAEMEIALKSERHVVALERHARAGKVPHGKALLGYTTTGEIVPHEAEVVQRIFAKFQAGESLRSLARSLTEEGVPTRSSRPWNTRTIRDILGNPRFAGWALYRREIMTDADGNPVRGQWEALVDPDTFTLVQAQLADPARKTNKVGTDRRYLGSRLYVCDYCGGPIQTVNGGKYFCSGHIIRDHKPVDAFVVDLIAQRLSQPDLATLLAPDQGSLKPLTEAAQRLRQRLEIADNDYAAGDIDAKLLKNTKTHITAELARIESQLAATRSGAALQGVVGAINPAQTFRDLSVMGQRAVIDALCTVRLRRAARGRPAKGKFFDSDTVDVDWRQ